MAIVVMLVVVIAASGVCAAVWLRRRDAELTLENALRRAPSLYAIAAVMVALGLLSLAAYLKPRWLWHLPLAIEAGLSVLVWRSIAAIMAFGFAITTTLAFISRHPRRWTLSICFVAVLLATTVIVGERTRPIAGSLEVKERSGVVLPWCAKTRPTRTPNDPGRLAGVYHK